MDGGAVDKRGVKRALRERLRAERAALPAEGRAVVDAALAARVATLPAFMEASAVLSYLSFGDEVDTRVLIGQALVAGVPTALPRCVPGTRDMDWYGVTSLDGLVRSRFGIDEPAPDPQRLVDVAVLGERAVALVPGLAFDERGCRIGYGGGFYDRFLATFPGVAVGLCREAALRRDLAAEGACEAHDRAVDLVVTEARVIDCR